MASYSDVVGNLINVRRERNVAAAEVVSWLEERGKVGDLVEARQAPGWARYHYMETEWVKAVMDLDSWLVSNALT